MEKANQELVKNHLDIKQRFESLERERNVERKLLQYLLKNDYDAETAYNLLANELDANNFCLYQTAKKMTGIDVSCYFPTEDTLGYFEDANGLKLLDWLIKARFGLITWRQVTPPYEMVDEVSFRGEELKIAAFYKDLYKRAVHKLLEMKE